MARCIWQLCINKRYGRQMLLPTSLVVWEKIVTTRWKERGRVSVSFFAISFFLGGGGGGHLYLPHTASASGRIHGTHMANALARIAKRKQTKQNFLLSQGGGRRLFVFLFFCIAPFLPFLFFFVFFFSSSSLIPPKRMIFNHLCLATYLYHQFSLEREEGENARLKEEGTHGRGGGGLQFGKLSKLYDHDLMDRLMDKWVDWSVCPAGGWSTR